MMNKGILYKIFIIPLLLIPLVCPFHISADTNIVPTYSGTSTQTSWTSKGGVVTNYCDDPLTGGSPCKLSFSFNDHYYGTVYFDAIFGSYATQSWNEVYITDGYGEFNYRTYTASPYQVTAVKIQLINLATPEDPNTLIWNFPVESYSAVSFAMNNLELSGIIPLNQYKYPIFDVVQYDNLFDVYLSSGQTVELIFYASFNITNANGLINYVITNGLSIQSIELIALVQNDIQGTGRFYRVILGGGTGKQYYIQANKSYKFMPIFCARNIDSIRNYIGTDFALQWGLTNSYLENVAKIANGTQSSSTSSDALETVSDDISSSSDDLIQSENSFNNSMNSNLQQIDTNINIGNLGSKFLASADWVRMQFNSLTNGTPFGSVLSFSLLLGLALVLVGRIRK